MTDTYDPDEPHAIRLFTEFIAQQRRGQTATELNDALRDILEAVEETGKKGALTLTIEIKPDGHMIRITDTIKTVIPQATRDAAFYFVTDDYALSTSDPDQPQLPLRSVDSPADRPIKEVNR